MRRMKKEGKGGKMKNLWLGNQDAMCRFLMAAYRLVSEVTLRLLNFLVQSSCNRNILDRIEWML